MASSVGLDVGRRRSIFDLGAVVVVLLLGALLESVAGLFASGAPLLRLVRRPAVVLFLSLCAAMIASCVSDERRAAGRTVQAWQAGKAEDLCVEYPDHRQDYDGLVTEADFLKACHDECVNSGTHCESVPESERAQAQAEHRRKRCEGQIQACETGHSDVVDVEAGQDDITSGVGRCFALATEIRGYQGEAIPSDDPGCLHARSTLERRCEAQDAASCAALAMVYQSGGGCVRADPLKFLELGERACGMHAEYACNLLASQGPPEQRLARALTACESGAVGWCHQACIAGNRSDSRVAFACSKEPQYQAAERATRQYVESIQRARDEDATAASRSNQRDPASSSTSAAANEPSMADAMRQAQANAARVNAPLAHARQQLLGGGVAASAATAGSSDSSAASGDQAEASGPSTDEKCEWLRKNKGCTDAALKGDQDKCRDLASQARSGPALSQGQWNQVQQTVNHCVHEMSATYARCCDGSVGMTVQANVEVDIRPPAPNASAGAEETSGNHEIAACPDGTTQMSGARCCPSRQVCGDSCCPDGEECNACSGQCGPVCTGPGCGQCIK